MTSYRYLQTFMWGDRWGLRPDDRGHWRSEITPYLLTPYQPPSVPLGCRTLMHCHMLRHHCHLYPDSQVQCWPCHLYRWSPLTPAPDRPLPRQPIVLDPKLFDRLLPGYKGRLMSLDISDTALGLFVCLQCWNVVLVDLLKTHRINEDG